MLPLTRVSSRQDQAIDRDTVVFGEVSLSGGLRPVAQAEARLRESHKLGFTSALTPERLKTAPESGLTVSGFDDLASFLQSVFGPFEA